MVQTLVENLTSQDFLLDISTSQSDTAPDLGMTEGYLGNNRLRSAAAHKSLPERCFYRLGSIKTNNLSPGIILIESTREAVKHCFQKLKNAISVRANQASTI